MIKAIFWLIIAWAVAVIGKAIGKILFPEDWK
jgi:hypothetical protein